MNKERFSSQEAVMMTGLSYRQLDYACSEGIVAPSIEQAHGSGSQRLFSSADIRLLRVMAVMRSMKLPGDTIHSALAYLSDKDLGAETMLVVTTEGEAKLPAMDLTLEMLATRTRGCWIINLEGLDPSWK